uniref:Uncharacterized protein n=1 Tax=Chaetoceros debilis TaxID=122233 RepID=A0A7S3Q7G4_9STRA|mmetsp:Transcript_263/g.472  ORF Transcript_263/g.472 Transcript_263/m.472 type:complete len:478 (+) Transcript_263:231-1664(+)
MSDEGGDDYDVEEPGDTGDINETEGYNNDDSNNAGFNNQDSAYEVENQSFGDKICDALAGIVIGLVLFIGAFPLLWWNEGRAVDAYKAINEGRDIFIPIDPTVIDAKNDNKLVYLTGLAIPSENLTDSAFGLEVSGSTKLQRNVEMYQYTEKKTSKKKKNIGGGTTTVIEYTYPKKWQSTPIDSSNFKKAGHTNPQNMPYTSESFYSTNVTLGAFTLPTDMIDRISSVQQLGDSLSTDIIPSGNTLVQEFQEWTYPNGYGFYFGNTTMYPYIGHTRVTFDALTSGTASIIARQVGSTFAPYVAESEAELYLVRKGIVSAEDMFLTAEANNKALAMVLRILGAVLMSVGIGLVLKPLEVVADVIPCIGDLVGAAICCVSSLIGVALSLIVIGIAWVANRPIILAVGGAGFVVVGLLVWNGIRMKKANQAQTASAFHGANPPDKKPVQAYPVEPEYDLRNDGGGISSGGGGTFANSLNQ